MEEDGVACRVGGSHGALGEEFVVEARHHLALCIGTRIASADKHYGDGCTRIDFERLRVEVAVGYAFEQRHQVALDARHDDFGLGIAHADVVFDDHGVAGMILLDVAVDADEAKEDEALIAQSFLLETCDGGANDAFFNLLHELVVGKRYGRTVAHAAGVGAGIAFADALVVLCHGQDLVVLTVGEHEDRAFDARQELLDDDGGRSCTKHTIEHQAEFVASLVEGGEDEHALAGCQTVGLEHIGCLELFEETACLVVLLGVERAIAGGGDLMTAHEALGKVLRAFELGCCLAGTDDADACEALVAFDVVVDAVDQGVFGAHDDHADLVLEAEVSNLVKLAHLDGDVLSVGACASVAWGNV